MPFSLPRMRARQLGLPCPSTRGRPRFDPAAAVAHLRGADQRLSRTIDTVGPLGLVVQPASSVFAGLAEAIVYQQLSGKAAGTIYRRVQALLGAAGRDPSPERLLAANDDELRGAGLSRAKTMAMRDPADRAMAGVLPGLADLAPMDDEAVIDKLTDVRGIGRGSAQMFLIFRLGRPDVLPVEDLGIRRGFAVVFGGALPAPDTVRRRGERWKPYRSAAAWYLWRVVDPDA